MGKHKESHRLSFYILTDLSSAIEIVQLKNHVLQKRRSAWFFRVGLQSQRLGGDVRVGVLDLADVAFRVDKHRQTRTAGRAELLLYRGFFSAAGAELNPLDLPELRLQPVLLPDEFDQLKLLFAPMEIRVVADRRFLLCLILHFLAHIIELDNAAARCYTRNAEDNAFIICQDSVKSRCRCPALTVWQ